jgi:hypothetical protein
VRRRYQTGLIRRQLPHKYEALDNGVGL